MNVTVVTGASRGIGAATAERLAAQGSDLVLTFLRHGDAAQAVAERCASHGVRVVAVRADVSIEDHVLAVFRAADAMGPLRALVNNAGVLDVQSRVADLTAARISRIFAVNVVGSMLCAREAVTRMSTRRGGQGVAIVNISSRAAVLGSPGEYVDYAASKAAVDALTVGLSKEVAAEGIRVNAVRPGLIRTELHGDGGEPERVARLAGTVPLGRGGEPDEVAAAVQWLLSEDASYVTGALLDVGGGR